MLIKMNFKKPFTTIAKPPKRDDLNVKYKTEMCRNWNLGVCTFGDNCFFAHGPEELRTKPMFSNYKTKHCKQFHELGYCQYGTRCQFKHRDRSMETASESPEPIRVKDHENFKKRLPIFAKIAPN